MVLPTRAAQERLQAPKSGDSGLAREALTQVKVLKQRRIYVGRFPPLPFDAAIYSDANGGRYFM